MFKKKKTKNNYLLNWFWFQQNLCLPEEWKVLVTQGTTPHLIVTLKIKKNFFSGWLHSV